MTVPIRPFFSKVLREIAQGNYGRTVPKPVRNYVGRAAKMAPAGEYQTVFDPLLRSSRANEPMTADRFAAYASGLEGSPTEHRPPTSLILRDYGTDHKYTHEQLPGGATASARMLGVQDYNNLGRNTRWATHTGENDLVHTRSVPVRSLKRGPGREVMEIQSDISQDPGRLTLSPANIADFENAKNTHPDKVAEVLRMDERYREAEEQLRQSFAARLRAAGWPLADRTSQILLDRPGRAQFLRAEGPLTPFAREAEEAYSPRGSLGRLSDAFDRAIELRRQSTRRLSGGAPFLPVSPWTQDQRWVKLGIGGELRAAAEDGSEFLLLPEVEDRLAATAESVKPLPRAAAELTYGIRAPQYARQILNDLDPKFGSLLRRFANGRGGRMQPGIVISPELRKAVAERGVPAFGLLGAAIQSGLLPVEE